MHPRCMHGQSDCRGRLRVGHLHEYRVDQDLVYVQDTKDTNSLATTTFASTDASTDATRTHSEADNASAHSESTPSLR